VSSVSNLASLIDAKRRDLLLETVAALPQSLYHAMPASDVTVDGCLRAVSLALRARNPHAIRRWLAHESYAPAPEELIACLDAAIAQITLELRSHRKTEMTQALRFLDWIRSDAALHLNDFTPGKASLMIGEHAVGIVDGLLYMMRVHDEATADHLVATGQLSERIATALGMSDEMVTRCRIAAQLHDLGKITVEAKILTKADPLTAIEVSFLRVHSEKAETMIAGIPAVAELAPIVRAHHERMDGTGYPDRLMGEEIPLESRVIAVADAFHTMTVPCAYREAMSVEAALKELSTHADKQFDEDVVEAFVETFGYSYEELRITA
jgi:HD-GYP domain-containing protein (c-di-GMP phosphodiesterase class II)